MKKLQVELFSSDNVASLQEIINEFIEGLDIVDIKYSSFLDDYSVLIIYEVYY